MKILSFTTRNPEDVFNATSFDMVPKGATIIKETSLEEFLNPVKILNSFHQTFIPQVGRTYDQVVADFLESQRKKVTTFKSMPKETISKSLEREISAVETQIRHFDKYCTNGLVMIFATKRYVSTDEYNEIKNNIKFTLCDKVTQSKIVLNSIMEIVDVYSESIASNPHGSYELTGHLMGSELPAKVFHTYSAQAAKRAA